MLNDAKVGDRVKIYGLIGRERWSVETIKAFSAKDITLINTGSVSFFPNGLSVIGNLIKASPCATEEAENIELDNAIFDKRVDVIAEMAAEITVEAQREMSPHDQARLLDRLRGAVDIIREYNEEEGK